MEENKEILELLKQMEKTSRRQARTGYLLCALALVTALCCVVTFVLIFNIVPQITEALPQLNALASQMQTVLGNLEQTTEQLASMDLTGMVTDVDNLVQTGQQSLEQTMEKLNSIDFDTLNKAIKNLSDVIEPLSGFMGIFK